MFQEVLADLEIGFGWGSMALNWINIYFSVAAWWRNVETNATLQIWEENLRNPCDSTSNLKLQTRGGQVANARWDKTGSCRATNEGEWVTPTSEASPGVHYSKKHPFVVISIEKIELSGSKVKFPAPGGFVLPTHTVGWVGEPD